VSFLFLHFKHLLPQSLKNLYHGFIALVALFRFRFPARHLTILAVTGTDGKTTTATILYHLLLKSQIKAALITTISAQFGSRSIPTGFHVTTPDPWQLQRLLRQIANRSFSHLILEVTSHALDQHRLLGITPLISILTNITPEHLDYHKSLTNYTLSKANLFKHSTNSYLNPHDSSYAQLKHLLGPHTRLHTYDIHQLPPNLRQAIEDRFPESYNQANATVACQVALSLNLNPTYLASAIKSFPGIPGRLQSIPNSRDLRLIVDFAHTPNGLSSVLKALKSTTKGKLIAVFGTAGLRDPHKRPQMGRLAAQIADEVILTAEDPRTESVHSIITQIRSGVTTNHGHVHSLPDRQLAINFALNLAKSGDTVVVLGKGHEQTMCFGTTETPWSDVKAVHKALSQLD